MAVSNECNVPEVQTQLVYIVGIPASHPPQAAIFWACGRTPAITSKLGPGCSATKRKIEISSKPAVVQQFDGIGLVAAELITHPFHCGMRVLAGERRVLAVVCCGSELVPLAAMAPPRPPLSLCGTRSGWSPFCHENARNAPPAPSVSVRPGEARHGAFATSRDTQNAYDENWTDRDRDRSGRHGDCDSPDLDDGNISQRAFRRYEVLG